MYELIVIGLVAFTQAFAPTGKDIDDKKHLLSSGADVLFLLSSYAVSGVGIHKQFAVHSLIEVRHMTYDIQRYLF